MESKPLTYRHKTSSSDVFRYCKAIGLPIAVFLLAMFCVTRFAAFGANLIAPLTGFMWAFGVATALLIPSQRTSLLTETCVTIGVYLIGLTCIRELISLTAGVSSEMLMAAYNQAIPLTAGSTISGYLQTILWITAVATPLGMAGKWGKQILTFRKRSSKMKTFKQLRNIRANGREHTD